MIQNKLDDFMRNKRATMLGIGPVSKNTVDASIELANECNIPLILIASRRQIDSEDFGGGYVNNWTTSKFSEYVKLQDKRNNIILARDHGGPWQNTLEIEHKMDLNKAINSAMKSYEQDIIADFEIIHIDSSIDIHSTPTIDETLNRMFSLYESCWDIAQANNKNICFEIGNEEQSGSTNTAQEVEYVLNKTISFCKKNKLPPPKFIVIQTGTRVMETKNIGSFDSPIRIPHELPAEIQVPKMIDICKKYKIYIKEHNADYLSYESLCWHPKLGIHSANVAPEFGVCETKALVKIMEEYQLYSLKDRFIKIAYESEKWKKWVLSDSKTTDLEKAIICGHYIFENHIFLDIKKEIQTRINFPLDEYLKKEVKKSIYRYLKAFRLLRLK